MVALITPKHFTYFLFPWQKPVDDASFLFKRAVRKKSQNKQKTQSKLVR